VEYPDRLETPHVRHEDIDDHQIERAIVQRGETALTAIRDRDPEPALLEPYAYGKAGVPVVIDYQDATHDDPPPLWRGRAQCALSAVPAKKDGLPHDRAGSFALRISALLHFCRKSTVCLPSTVYKAGSTTPAQSDCEFFARSPAPDAPCYR
jgi:hypothetical protein